jgi:hypothetical protein
METGAVLDYPGKTDDELLGLGLEADFLTADAPGALSGELRRRKLDSPARLTEFSRERNYYKHLDDVNLGNLTPSLLLTRGIGRRAYGRSNVEIRGTSEEYDTTVFAVVFFFPLVPMGTYRFSREQGRKQFQVLEKKPIDRSQVALVWVKALAVVAAIPFALDVFLRFVR